MFIELTDILRCPADHDEAYLVLAPQAMDGRRVITGVLGCPVCRAEYPIVEGVAEFGSGAARRLGGLAAGHQGGQVADVERGMLDAQPPGRLAAQPPAYDAGALLAFFDLSGPGGYVCLVGGAARHAPGLAAAAGVHVVAVNPPAGGVAASGSVSLLRAAAGLPIKTRQVRAVALGTDHTGGRWMDEAVRVLLPGLRLVIEDETARPAGTSDLARGAGLLVARKSNRG